MQIALSSNSMQTKATNSSHGGKTESPIQGKSEHIAEHFVYWEKAGGFGRIKEGWKAQIRCASLDGDAERLLYFCVLPSKEIQIVDGDKILCLFTLFINE